MRKYILDSDSDSNQSDDDEEKGLPGSSKQKTAAEIEAIEAEQIAMGIPPSPTRRSGLDDIKRETEGIVLVHEHLGEDFWKKVWRPPVITESEDYRRSQLYRQGEGHSLMQRYTSAPDLVLGMRLYVQFLKTMTIGFMFIFLIAIPLLAFAWYGHAMLYDEKDAIGLSRLVLGNVGKVELEGTGQYDYTWEYCTNNNQSATLTNTTTTTYNTTLSSNSSNSDSSGGRDDTCLFIEGHSFRWKEVSAIILGGELIQVLLFLLLLCHLRCRKRWWLWQEKLDQPIMMRSYSIMIENLPFDITEDELIQHFSTLYQLSVKDFKGRLPIEDLRPVQHFGNTEDKKYLNSWIAECTLYRQIGPLLSLYQERQRWMYWLFRNRSQMKMYRPSSQHPGGENMKRFKRAEIEMLRSSRKVDSITFAIKELILQKYIGMKKKKQSIEDNNSNNLQQQNSSCWSRWITSSCCCSTGNGCCSSSSIGNCCCCLSSSNKEVLQEVKVFPIKEPSKQLLDNSAATSSTVEKTKEPVGTNAGTGSPDAGNGDTRSTGRKDKKDDEEDDDEDDELNRIHKIQLTAEEEQEIAKHIQMNNPTMTMSSKKQSSPVLSPPSHSISDDTVLVKRIDRQLDDAPVVCAFLIFEHNESFARCLEDYRFYQIIPFNFFYPKVLKIRGSYCPQISIAPEPEQVLWENLEIPKRKKINQKIFSFVIILFLLFLNFVVIVISAMFRYDFVHRMPTEDLCNQLIPSLYGNVSYDSTILDQVDLRRPSTNRTLLDRDCQDLLPNSFYATYVIGNETFGNYSLLACHDSTKDGDQCPLIGSTHYCPCLSSSYHGHCQTATCQANTTLLNSSSICQGFRADAPALCYCRDHIDEMSQWHGFVEYAKMVFTGKKGEYQEICHQYSNAIVIVFVLRYGSILFTLYIDWLLQEIIPYRIAKEGFISFSQSQRALYFRLFLASYINLTLLILPSYGMYFSVKSPGKVDYGLYTDFIRAWYGDVGGWLGLLFIVYTFLPWLVDLCYYTMLWPWRRQWIFGEYLLRGGHYVTLQKDLNDLQIGPTFPLAHFMARLTTIIFFAMSYAPGIPLLMPITFIIFLLYYALHRSMLLKYYRMPHYSTAIEVIDMATMVLPYATIIRLAFAAWMLSADDILSAILPAARGIEAGGSQDGLSTAIFSLKKYMKLVDDVSQDNYILTTSSLAFIEERVKHSNVFACVILAAIILAVILVEYADTWCLCYLRRSFWKILQFCYKHCRRKPLDPLARNPGYLHGYEIITQNHPLRSESAPFTGVYYRYLGRKTIDDIWWKTCLPLRYQKRKKPAIYNLPLGWQVQDMGWDFEVKVKHWPSKAEDEEGMKIQGDHKRTYEIIADEGYGNSYRLELLPYWSYVYIGLREMDINYSFASHYLTTLAEETKHLKFNPTIVEDRLNETKRGIRNKIVPMNEEGNHENDVADYPPLLPSSSPSLSPTMSSSKKLKKELTSQQASKNDDMNTDGLSHKNHANQNNDLINRENNESIGNKRDRSASPMTPGSSDGGNEASPSEGRKARDMSPLSKSDSKANANNSANDSSSNPSLKPSTSSHASPSPAVAPDPLPNVAPVPSKKKKFTIEESSSEDSSDSDDSDDSSSDSDSSSSGSGSGSSSGSSSSSSEGEEE